MERVVAERTDNMNLRKRLGSVLEGNVVVMGIGNPSRGDDAAGSRIAQQICRAPGVCVIDAQDVPENYLCRVADHRPETIVLIDCVDMKSAPGSVAHLDMEKDRTAAYWPSTHRAPLGLLVDYLERTTRARVFLLAIQPRQTGLFEPMSAEMLSSVESVADLLNDVFETRRIAAGEVPA